MPLHQVSACPFTDRWQWLWFTFDCPEALTHVRLNIKSVRAPADGVQLGHFHLFVHS